MNQISTIRNFFDALGGMQSVADLVGVKQTAVYMAVNRGSIPHRWRMTLFQEAKARKVKFNPEILGLNAA